ncbi:MAG: hypothetical protein KC621_11610 [Myxococcales bacterium]|nr:hypothetical protein [Myxococcales bacterium]
MFDPVFDASLARIAASSAVPRPNAELVRAAAGLTAPPLAALAKAMSDYTWGPTIGRFELTLELLAENGYAEEIFEALGDDGVEGVVFAESGGGEEALLLVADASRPGGYHVYRYAYDGAPYPNGDVILSSGRSKG